MSLYSQEWNDTFYHCPLWHSTVALKKKPGPEGTEHTQLSEGSHPWPGLDAAVRNWNLESAGVVIVLWGQVCWVFGGVTPYRRGSWKGELGTHRVICRLLGCSGAIAFIWLCWWKWQRPASRGSTFQLQVQRFQGQTGLDSNIILSARMALGKSSLSFLHL